MKWISKRWEPIPRFLGHIFVVGTLFLILAAVSVGLAMVVQQLEGTRLPALTLRVLILLEQALLVCDAALFLIFVAWLTVGAIREMMK